MADGSTEETCKQLKQALDLRKKYQCRPPPETNPGKPVGSELTLSWRDGIMQVCAKGSNASLFEVPSLDEYYDDMSTLFQIRSSGPVSSYCYQRLRLLQTKFELYSMVSGDQESQEAIDAGHRDFYNVRKVDTHIHHSAAMNAKHLLRFMKKKLRVASDDIVEIKDGKNRTLKNVFDDMGLGWTELCIDGLQVWADKSCMHRFDRFNNKYSPMGQNELRTIFLKTDNAIGGRYLAELTKELISDLEDSKYQHAEWRLSIYGRKMSEWDYLSKWVLGVDGKGLGNGKALLSPNVRWMIQIPRLFSLYKITGSLDNFGQMLENIFTPMFEATLKPDAHPHIARFLENISGFDTVDDESKSLNPLDRTSSSRGRTPAEWDLNDNPSYKYYSYFIQANLRVLNMLRQQRGLNTFAYRPHAGEAGEVHHLDTAFLLADGINHGLNLRKSMGLQYLFYLAQIGLAMSPCSNNQLFLAYEKSPYPVYFSRGLNVSLSTDDPLMFHYTKEPLMEEYSIAKQLWHFTSVDLCEMARNSVLQSGFCDQVKAAWLGSANFLEENEPKSTNVPNLRIRFRHQVFKEELQLLSGGTSRQDDVGTMCNLLLLSPKSRKKKINGLEENKPSLSMPRVASLPGEDFEPGEFKDSIVDGEDEAAMDDGGWGSRSWPQPDGGPIKRTLSSLQAQEINNFTKSLPASNRRTALLPELTRQTSEDLAQELKQMMAEEFARASTHRSQISWAIGLGALAGSFGGAAVAAWLCTKRTSR